MREAHILHCEDYQQLRHTISSLISARVPKYQVVAEAESVAQAHEHLLAFSRHALDLQVVLLDGELKDGTARDVISYMEELGIELPIIGLSGNGLAAQGLMVGKELVADIAKTQNDLIGTIVTTLRGLPGTPSQPLEQQRS